MNNNETKDVLIFRKLRAVQKNYEGVRRPMGFLDIFAMAKDSADVIDDLHKEIQILQRELMAEKVAHNEDLCVMGSGPIPEDRKNVFEEQKNSIVGLTRDEIRGMLIEEGKLEPVDAVVGIDLGPDELPQEETRGEYP